MSIVARYSPLSMPNMKIDRFLLKLTCIVLVCACSEKDDIVFDSSGVAIWVNPQWSASLSNNQDPANEFVVTSIVYNENNVLLGFNRDGQRKIISLNTDNGQLNWEWADFEGLKSKPDYKGPIYLDRKAYHMKNNSLFFNYSTMSFCIDLSSGQTIWKYESNRDHTGNNAGIGDMYFSSGPGTISGYLEPSSEENVYSGKLNSPDEERLLLTPEYTPVDFPLFNGALNGMEGFEKDGKVYLAFGIENPGNGTGMNKHGATELNLYNVTDNKYEYKKIIVNKDFDTQTISDLNYQDSYLYFQSSNFVHSCNAMTGEERWRTPVENYLLPSGMIRR